MEEPESTAEFTPGSSFSLNDPVQYALSIHLILRGIFTQFGKRKDLNSLLSVRAVCTLWFEEALDILHDFSELIPSIFTHPREYGSNYKRTMHLDPVNNLPTGGLPLNLIVSHWTPQVVRFLKDREEDIVSLHLSIPNSDEFSLEQESFQLENLKFASLEYLNGQDVAAESYHSKRFQDALKLFLDLIKHAVQLKKCEVFLSGVWNVAASYQEQLAHLPRNLNKLQIRLECMENMVRFQSWPCLNSLYLLLEPGNGIVSSQCISTDVASRLTSLNLEVVDRTPNTFPRLRLPVLPKLTKLELEEYGIHGDVPLPELMPQLNNVKIESSRDHDIVSCLVTSDFRYPNVTDFTLIEYEALQNVDHVRRMTDFTRTFPNLVILSITGKDFNIVATAPIIFSSLKRLRCLSLREVDPTRLWVYYDVVQLITGVSRDDIPEDETTWPDLLVGSPNAITKLTDLREFTLRLIINRTVTQRESKFLFKAAFLRMTHLKLINFGFFRFERLENEVQAEWEAGGRDMPIMKIEGDEEEENENEEGGLESDNDGENDSDNEGEEDENGGQEDDQ